MRALDGFGLAAGVGEPDIAAIERGRVRESSPTIASTPSSNRSNRSRSGGNSMP